MVHNCIKCSAQYEDEDPDPYYCAECNELRIAAAKEVDAKMSGRPKKPIISALQEYDNSEKIHGFVRVHL